MQQYDRDRRALMSRPKMILLDERVAGSRPAGCVEEIFAIVERLNKEEDVGFLVAEAEHQHRLRHGRLAATSSKTSRFVMDGAAAALRSNEDVKEFYLGLSATGRKSYRRGQALPPPQGAGSLDGPPGNFRLHPPLSASSGRSEIKMRPILGVFGGAAALAAGCALRPMRKRRRRVPTSRAAGTSGCRGSTLTAALCRRANNRGEQPTALNVAHCAGDIGNNNGQLQCSGGQPAAPPPRPGTAPAYPAYPAARIWPLRPGYPAPGSGPPPRYGEEQGYRERCEGLRQLRAGNPRPAGLHPHMARSVRGWQYPSRPSLHAEREQWAGGR